jgi:hypothetical protein
MKVTRLRKGVRIHLTDIQYEMLCHVYGNGIEELEDLCIHEPARVRAFNRVTQELTNIHEDRR